MEVLTEIAKYCGATFLILGGFFEIIGAIGFIRMPDFFTRAHAVTVASVGGAVLPLIGIALISLSHTELGLGRVYLASLCLITALLLLIVVSTGSHALVRAALRTKTRAVDDRNRGS
ncbi:MAG: monovalent cation/H(+) antiporter subunit G [Ignisphaera sp.]|uniref:Cation:proton antiporter n=1 Tax=Ignisphaera aggregans TaxID=334771 RepID=A0A7C4NM29_9CREN